MCVCLCVFVCVCLCIPCGCRWASVKYLWECSKILYILDSLCKYQLLKFISEGPVQKTEAPQKPRKADDERSKIHHYIYIYIYIYIYMCVCVFVCVYVKEVNVQISEGQFKKQRPPKTQESGWRVFKNPSLYIYIYVCVCLCACLCEMLT